MEVLAKRLKWLRNNKGYAQKEVAKMIGMTTSAYQKFELNERQPKLDILLKFCDIYDVTSDFLLGREIDNIELERLRVMLKQMSHRVSVLTSKHKEFLTKISNMRAMMIEVAAEKGFNHSETAEISKELDALLSQVTALQQELVHQSSRKNDIVKMYIEVFLEIPFSNAKYDSLISEFAPYTLHEQATLFETFDLILTSNTLGSLGSIKTDVPYEEIDEIKKDVAKRINGF
ncbi:XRE family transcriptional regulator [Cytobacillus gottheilii]|uniref:XRE family transcriptional regulator n=1 Tax=Cytobacillus gottheilii TaxID=859144 RepID=UPI001594CDF6|nr:XRE family transcriptional regulator [Cytobacillus gottheilii]